MSPRLSDALLRAQSDERLVALARQGRERAFAILVERHRAPLLAFARHAVGEGRGEDVVQQAFLQAWSSLSGGAQVAHVRGWLFSIVRHVAWRTAAGQHEGELPESLAAGATPEEAVARRLEVDELLVALAALPERQRAALIQTALEGRSRREVAEALGLTEGAVRQLVHRARSSLRAAASALTPMPLVEWAVRGGVGQGGMAGRIAEVVAATGGGAGLTGALVKTGAVVVATGAIAGGVAERERVDRPAAAKAAVAPQAVRELSAATGAGPAREAADDRRLRRAAGPPTATRGVRRAARTEEDRPRRDGHDDRGGRAEPGDDRGGAHETSGGAGEDRHHASSGRGTREDDGREPVSSSGPGPGSGEHEPSGSDDPVRLDSSGPGSGTTSGSSGSGSSGSSGSGSSGSSGSGSSGADDQPATGSGSSGPGGGEAEVDDPRH